MIFHTAGIEVAPWIPPLVAFAISFFTSMGGISGAFLLLPFQMTCLGYTNPSVSATNQLFNVVAIPSGVYRYVREGRMVWPLTWIVVAGTLPGVFAGALIRVAWLPDPGHFKLFAAGVLFYIGIKLVRDLLTQKAANGLRPGHARPSADSRQAVLVNGFNWKRITYTFGGESFHASSPGIFTLSLVVGIVGGVYGIGGGSIIAPFLITVFGLPVHTVAGAALMGTFVTSVAGVLFYQLIAPFYPHMAVAPDWLLGLLFGIGGMAGMYMGARCQRFVPARLIKWMLAAIIGFTAIKYVAGFFS
ncbi:MAG: sulfite exporter TauE/SafE family protein [Thermodesulfobacteriota bacterium]|nr:sulfite exporter TauE/SafE family protein [Thermodesulfobacteriota bacterium]